jgi:hypothetical protein
MKTTTNVQKTNLKSVIFAAGLIVIGFSVDGQGATKPDLTIDNNQQNVFASARMLPATTASKAKGASTSFAAYTAPAAEEALSLESWMTDESRFYETEIRFETATEEVLTVESWMTNQSRFDGTETCFEPATEEALAVESWMTDEKNFTDNVKKPKTEKTVVFEMYTSKFMYCELIFEKELSIEPWMINSQVWK